MSTDIRNVDLTLPLAIRFLGDERRAIERKLNGMTSQYFPEVDGVLIKWSDLNILNDKGYIIDDQPFVFWKISFTAQVFKPIDGKCINGKVHRLQKCYFIAKAMNTFTVTVSIPESLLNHDIIKTLKIDQEVYFRIKGSSEGIHRAEMDQECLELTKGLLQRDLEMVDGDAYSYAKDFDY